MSVREATALVILVPAAESLVQTFREKYDPSAAAGMPAHITLLYPFKHPDQVNDLLLDDLRMLFSSHARFQFSLVGTRGFPGVLYLAPEPSVPFKKLTRAIATQYPETPPYGGAFPDTVPHLTVAERASSQELMSIEEEFSRVSAGRLPIHAAATEVCLMEKRGGRWRNHTSFALAEG